MPKYRKKPVVVEAFQMTQRRGSDNFDWPWWLHAAWQLEPEEVGSFLIQTHNPRRLAIRTLEGVMSVSWGDYIIRGVEGELYPCKASIFEATYEIEEAADEP